MRQFRRRVLSHLEQHILESKDIGSDADVQGSQTCPEWPALTRERFNDTAVTGRRSTGFAAQFEDSHRPMELACHNMDSVAAQLATQASGLRRHGMSIGVRRQNAAIILAGILSISLLLWVIPAREVETLNFLHHLNFIPLLLAGRLLGWRAALAGTGFAALAQSPYIWVTQQVSVVNAVDQIIELSIFGVAGVVAGFLSERERRHRQDLETATVELERVYQELRQNVDRLKKAERLYAAGQLSAGLAHEIRNPLASISGAAALLKRSTGETQNFLECLEIIDKESQRLNKLLSHFLEFARPRAPRFQPTDLEAVIHSVLALASHMSASGIELREHIQPGLPEIQCDPEQIKQVLLNLLINAVQAIPSNGIVEISASGNGTHVQIAVRDEGTGLGPEQRDRIFDPFFTTKENGTGLGLAIASKIVEQHGGHLSAENNATRGTTFRLDLPVEQAMPA